MRMSGRVNPDRPPAREAVLPSRRAAKTQGRRGGTTVEFALVLPMLLLVMSAIIDFSWVFFQMLTVNRAVRYGSRLGAIHMTDAQIRTAIKQQAGLGMTDGAIVITVKSPTGVTQTAGNRTRGNRITIQVNYPISFLTPLGGIMRAGNFTQVSPKTEFTIE